MRKRLAASRPIIFYLISILSVFTLYCREVTVQQHGQYKIAEDFKQCLADTYKIDASGISLIMSKVHNFLTSSTHYEMMREFIRISEALDLSSASEPYTLPADDGVLVAPETHQVLFEDTRIRILWGHVPSGSYVPMHTHSWKSIVIILTPESLKVEFANGKTEYEECPAGVYQFPSDEQAIAYTNLGAHDCYHISFEIKK